MSNLMPKVKMKPKEDVKLRTTSDESSDSDSGLDTSISSLSKFIGESQNTSSSSSSSSPEIQNKFPKSRKERRRLPMCGVSMKTNPGKSWVRTKKSPSCMECGSELIRRQPLKKTNGILFLGQKEQEYYQDLSGRPSYSHSPVKRQAFIRSDIVRIWNDELQEEILGCESDKKSEYRQLIRNLNNIIINTEPNEAISNTAGNKTINDKIEIDSVNIEEDKVKEKSDGQNKLAKKFKKLSFPLKRTKSISALRHKLLDITENPDDHFIGKRREDQYQEVKPKPITYWDNDLETTLLRLHCDYCAIRDKPSDFASGAVLFVCQL